MVADGAPPTGDLKKRLYISVHGLGAEERGTAFCQLARALLPRARAHAVITWLRDQSLSVEQRTVGFEWLCAAEPAVLAEFMAPIAQLHRGAAEDNVVCRLLATVLGLTGLPEAQAYLRRWLDLASHPDARYGIQKAIRVLDLKGVHAS